MEVSGELHTPRPLYTHGKSLWYPLDRKLGGHGAIYIGETRNAYKILVGKEWREETTWDT
jgi:hypothetical protein